MAAAKKEAPGIFASDVRASARPFIALALFLGVAAGYGLASSRLPAPRDETVFWISNLSAPYALMPFLAGWVQRSRAWAAVAGILVASSMIAGFYQLTWNTTFAARWLLIAVPVGLLYGVLGHAWRNSRSALAVLALGLAAITEPLFWYVKRGFLPTPYAIWVIEVTVGAIATFYLLRARSAQRSPLAPS